MKTSELFAHMEDGGEIICIGLPEKWSLIQVKTTGVILESVLNRPDTWELVAKPVNYSVDFWLMDQPFYCGAVTDRLTRLFGTNDMFFSDSYKTHQVHVRVTVEEIT